MREILFRGKSVETNEWVYGSCILEKYGNTPYICYFEYGTFVNIKQVEVIPETVGQFTGLTDRNGKKIFEGDIVQGYKTEFTPPKKYRKPFVATMKTSLPNSVEEYYSPFEHFTEKVKWEIIGNIHDNPELLKGGVE